MTWADIPGTLIVAVLSSAIGAAGIVLGLRIAGHGRYRDVALLVAPIVFFLVLTHYPLPNPADVSCPVAGVETHVIPFHTLFSAIEMHRYIPAWEQRLVQAAVANLVLCLLIGAAAARLTDRAVLVIGGAAFLSLTIEISQLTGMFGIYPCAIRHFDVDDLILNIGGVAAGFTVMQHAVKRRGRAGGARDAE